MRAVISNETGNTSVTVLSVILTIHLATLSPAVRLTVSIPRQLLSRGSSVRVFSELSESFPEQTHDRKVTGVVVHQWARPRATPTSSEARKRGCRSFRLIPRMSSRDRKSRLRLALSRGVFQTRLRTKYAHALITRPRLECEKRC